MSREALKMALEALNKLTDVFLDTEGNHGDYEQKALTQGNKTILAIKEALVTKDVSLPEQEPVASMEVKTSKAQISYSYSPEHGGFALPDGTYKFYTSPPQRTWVHLTNQEHDEIAIACGCLSADWVFYGAVLERKIKEKNTT